MTTVKPMSSEELKTFMQKHGFSAEQLGDKLGVTGPAVVHWMFERRKIPPTAAKLIRFFDLNPQLMGHF